MKYKIFGHERPTLEDAFRKFCISFRCRYCPFFNDTECAETGDMLGCKWETISKRYTEEEILSKTHIQKIN